MALRIPASRLVPAARACGCGAEAEKSRVASSNEINRSASRPRAASSTATVSRCCSICSSGTLPDVSTKAATAVLVSNTVSRGCASASKINANTAALSNTATPRWVWRHCHSAHAAGTANSSRIHSRSNVNAPPAFHALAPRCLPSPTGWSAPPSLDSTGPGGRPKPPPIAQTDASPRPTKRAR